VINYCDISNSYSTINYIHSVIVTNGTVTHAGGSACSSVSTTHCLIFFAKLLKLLAYRWQQQHGTSAVWDH